MAGWVPQLYLGMQVDIIVHVYSVHMYVLSIHKRATLRSTCRCLLPIIAYVMWVELKDKTLFMAQLNWISSAGWD